MSIRAKAGKVCRHCMGLTFTHPSDWGALRTCDGVILTPPTFAAETPSIIESYVIMTEASTGVSRATDAAIWSSMDELVRGQLPCLKRVTDVESVACGRGSGARAAWAGCSPSGQEVSARVYVSLASHTLAALVAVGPASCVQSRMGALEGIFASFRHEPCRRDPELVGTWIGSRRRGPSVDDLGDQGLRLQVDGTFRRGLGRRRGAGGGTWSATDGRLVLAYEARAAAEYSYRFEAGGAGRRLVLIGADGRAVEMRLSGA
jgi:hypothetical protein